MMTFLELRFPPVAQLLVAGIAIWALDVACPSTRLNLSATPWIALALAIIGLVLALQGVMAFGRAKTTVDPRAPQEAENLVTTGIYGISRNPMYLAFVLILAAWGIYLQQVFSVALLALFVAYLTRFQIVPEERMLREKFGDEYTAYCSKVPRLL